jgi:hypothetical protein
MRRALPAIALAALLLLAGCSGIPLGGGNSIAYDDLDEDQQVAFREATEREGGVDLAGVDAAPFRNNDYVRYEGHKYEVAVDRRRAASYTIDASLGDPSEDATVRAVDDLPPEVREEIRTAVTEGDYYAPVGKWDALPEPLNEVDYVHYENGTYELSYVIGDAVAEILTVEKVE